MRDGSGVEPPQKVAWAVRAPSAPQVNVVGGYDEVVPRESVTVGSVTIDQADALTRYADWPAPTVIIADGPYGIGGFPGDPPTPAGLPSWYAPHIAAWSVHSLPETTLWFWGTEVGWATVHGLLDINGWDYRSAHVWDKGKAHIAGNVNGNTIRRYPVVTEVCVQYTRRVEIQTIGDDSALISLPMQRWMRHEWTRAGLPLALTNEAAGVRNAATRKWFTSDHLWYYPPANAIESLAAYANEHGRATDRPYFSLDGERPVTAAQWQRLRAKWHYSHGITNVWSEPPVRGEERIRGARAEIAHANQKPYRLMERIVTASSDQSDVVWEPFAGLATAAVACLRTERRCFAAEILPEFFQMAKHRLQEARDAGRQMQAFEELDDLAAKRRERGAEEERRLAIGA